MPEQQDWHPQAFSLVAQMVKYPPATQETCVWPLGWEDPLEKGMTTHSGILVWRIPWTEEPGRLQSVVLQRAGRDGRDLVYVHVEYHAACKE